MSNKPNNLRYSMNQAQFCDDTDKALKHFYPENEYIVFYELTGCKAEEVNFHVIPKAEEAEHVPNSKCPCCPIKTSTVNPETPLFYLHGKSSASDEEKTMNNINHFEAERRLLGAYGGKDFRFQSQQLMCGGYHSHVIPRGTSVAHIPDSMCACSPGSFDQHNGKEVPGHYLHNEDAPVKNKTKPNYYIEGTPQYPVPFGHYVLLKLTKYDNVSKGGIVLGTVTQEKREQDGQEVGEVMEFGPTAYMGFSGFEGPEAWGIKIGDIVEFKRYEGKKCELPGYELFHYIPDSLLIGGNRSADDE